MLTLNSTTIHQLLHSIGKYGLTPEFPGGL